MKTNRVIFITLVLVLLVGTTSVDAASLNNMAANQRWTVQLFKGGENGVRNLSTAFVGTFQTPILSYSKVGDHYIHLAHAATAAVPGNCGPNNKWHCGQWLYGNLVPGTLSPMAAMQKTDTHLLQWAFSTGNMIRGTTIELKNDMSYYTYSQQDLLQLNKFGGTLVGTPTLRIWWGGYQLAATIRDNTDLYGYKLVYMDSAFSSNTSCLDGASQYQCDVIDQSYGLNSMGAPSLQVAPDGSVGIAYYKSGAGLMYAYPHMSSPLIPSNCGPGGNYWRCISIFADVGTSAIGKDVKLAVGATGSNMDIAFTFGNTSFGKYLFHAGFVGSGGNCGTDLNYLGVSMDMWKCNLIAFLGILDRSYSIAVDPQGYSVIAYEYALTDDSPVDLYLAYPNARVGIAGPGWMEQQIDGAPSPLVDTGAQAALSLNSAGLGFIGYLQEEDYELPDLKITWQQFGNFLPLIKR